MSVAASGQQVVVIWAATASTQTNVYAAVSHDGGRSFGAPVRVNDIDGDARVNGEQPPKVAIGRDVVAMWESRAGGLSRVRLARSIDGGRTFQPAETIHEPGLTGARGWGSLAMDADGTAHVAWLDGRHAAVKTAPAPGEQASHAHAEPMRQDIFQVAIRTDGSRVEAPVATNVCFCCKTAVATSPDGATYVAWRHLYPTNLRDIAVAQSADRGLTFGPPVRVSEDQWQIDGCPEDGPSIVASSGGHLHVAWPTMVQDGMPRKAVFYSYSTDAGQTFAPRVLVSASSQATAVSAHPQIAISNTAPMVVWDESDPAARRVRLRLISLPPGTTGSSVLSVPLTISDDPPASYPAVAATSDAAVIAWLASVDSGTEIRLRRLALPVR